MDFAGLVIAGISALGTLVQAYYSARQNRSQVSHSTLKKAAERASTPLKTGTKVVDNVIDDALLKALSEEVLACNQRLIDAIVDKNLSEARRVVAVEDARAQICRVLSQIRQFNEGTLPTRRLEKLWASHRC